MKREKISLKRFCCDLLLLIKPSLSKIKIACLMILFSELVKLLGPYIFKLIIDLLTNFDKSKLLQLVWLVLAMFLANQFMAFINYLNNKRLLKISVEVENYLPVTAQEKLIHLSLSYHEKEDTGNKIIKIEKGVDKVVGLLDNMFWEVLPTLFQVVATTAILFFVDWRFSLVFIVFVPIFAILTTILNSRVAYLRKERFDHYELAGGKMAETILNINAVKSFVREEGELEAFAKIKNKIKDLSVAEFLKRFKYNWNRDLVIDIGRVLILILAVYLIYNNQISVGSLVFVITISEKALISLYRLSRLYDRIMESSESVQRFAELYNETSDIVNKIDGLKPRNIIGNLEFKNLSFAYNESNKEALRQVNFKIPAGQTTALVGPSGSGKTTLVKMIYRHYDPMKGQVLLDDCNLKDYDLYSFRKFLAIVPQEVEIFNNSIRNNIAYANPEASWEEVEAAAKIANVDEYAKQLKDGYETIVGERGIKLSGGQRQRLGIARAILANPRILIFDEATSSLDSYSEKLIQESMEKVSQNRTVIIIAHRLSTIRKADKIVVMEHGQVVEEGNHKELAKLDGGLYARLLKLQQMGDLDE